MPTQDEPPVNILETERLTLRRITLDDADFIHRLLNEPSFLEFIGDKGVRTLDDACDYIRRGPLASYERFGFGLFITALKDGTRIGICGLVKRDGLEDVDVGFAFLPEFWSKGYAVESAAAVMAYGQGQLGLQRIVAIVKPDNDGSIRVLEKLGLKCAGMVAVSGTTAN